MKIFVYVEDNVLILHMVIFFISKGFGTLSSFKYNFAIEQ